MYSLTIAIIKFTMYRKFGLLTSLEINEENKEEIFKAIYENKPEFSKIDIQQVLDWNTEYILQDLNTILEYFDYLNYKGTDVEGLYRVPGSGPQVKKWQRKFDEGMLPHTGRTPWRRC